MLLLVTHFKSDVEHMFPIDNFIVANIFLFIYLNAYKYISRDVIAWVNTPCRRWHIWPERWTQESYMKCLQFIISIILHINSYTPVIGKLIRTWLVFYIYETNLFLVSIFQLSKKMYYTGICQRTFEIVHREVLWSIIKQYEVSLSKMLHDIIQWHPQLIRHYTNLWTSYRTGSYYRFWPYYQIKKFGGFP